MTTKEQVLRQIDEAWQHGSSRGGILVSDLADINIDYIGRLFEDTESDLAVHENDSGLTVVDCLDPNTVQDPRTILAAHLSSDRNRLYIEAHNYKTATHQNHSKATNFDAWNTACHASILNVQDMSVSRFEFRGKSQAVEIAIAAEPWLTAARARTAKVLGLLLEADVTADVFSSGYARRKLTETHCMENNPPITHPAEAFYTQVVQQALREAIPASA